MSLSRAHLLGLAMVIAWPSALLTSRYPQPWYAPSQQWVCALSALLYPVEGLTFNWGMGTSHNIPHNLVRHLLLKGVGACGYPTGLANPSCSPRARDLHMPPTEVVKTVYAIILMCWHLGGHPLLTREHCQPSVTLPIVMFQSH